MVPVSENDDATQRHDYATQIHGVRGSRGPQYTAPHQRLAPTERTTAADANGAAEQTAEDANPRPDRAPEQVVARLRPHARVLAFPSLVVIAGAGAIGYFAGTFDEEWQNLALLWGGSAVLFLVLILPLLAWLTTRYTITTRRIVLRHGVFTRMRQELLHSCGYDITVRKGALQSVFRSGDVLINAGLEHPVVLRDVPQANLVQEALHDLMESAMNPIAARRGAEMSHPDNLAPWGRH